MIQTFKKNPALYIGLALPLLMILMFTLIPFVASFVVPPPKYDFIYSLNSYRTSGKLQVVQGKLELETYNQTDLAYEAPAVYLVDVQSKKSTKLNFALSKGENTLVPPQQHRTFVLEGIQLKDLDTSLAAPDGYQLLSDDTDVLHFLPFFFRVKRQPFLSISKAGRVEKFQTQGDRHVKFEGWVIPSPQ